MFEKLGLILPKEAYDGPMQMALDEVLLRNVSTPTLRIYNWVAPCVSFGYFQKSAEVKKIYSKVPIVRRWTGGGIVEHGDDLTFSIMVPEANSVTGLSPANFYKELHHALAVVIGRYSQKEIVLAGEKEILVGASCFSAPSRDDLLFQGKKILGGAQRRSKGALLYQGSLQHMIVGGESALLEPLVGSLSKQVSITDLESAIKNEAICLAETRYRSVTWNDRW